MRVYAALSLLFPLPFSCHFSVFYIGVLSVFLSFINPLFARSYTTTIEVNSVEQIYELESLGELDEEEVELLAALLERPMALNRADRYMLYDLPRLTWELADAIVQFRVSHGPFATVEELLNLPEIDVATLNSIRPFLHVNEDPTAKQVSGWRIYGRSEGALSQQLGKDLRQPSDANIYALPDAYISLKLTHQNGIGAGVFASGAQRLQPVWDVGTGRMIATGGDCTRSPEACAPFNPRLDGFYLSGEWRRWRAIVGDYNVGFGERLIFDSTVRGQPSGFDERWVVNKNRDSGRVRLRPNLRGVAIQLDSAPMGAGWLDLSLFASVQNNDIYQYDLWYEGDKYFSVDHCPDGYTCGAGVVRHASQIVEDIPINPRSFQFSSIANAFTEQISGGNVRYNFDEQTYIGLTAYGAQIDFLIAPLAVPNFSYSAKYPRRSRFGAAGLSTGFLLLGTEVNIEAATTDQGAMALVGRWVWSPMQRGELNMRFYIYGRDYDNPHARSQAPPLETFGSRRRNRRGGDVKWRMAMGDWLLQSQVAFYQMPEQEHFVEDTLQWLKAPVSYLRVQQKMRYKLSRYEHASLQLQYNNNGLNKNSRQQFYRSEARNDRDYSATLGAGENRKVLAEFATKRLRWVTATMGYAYALVDVKKLTSQFDQEHYLRGALRGQFYSDTRWGVSGRYWLKQSSDRYDDDLRLVLSLKQRLAEGLFMQMTYGVLGVYRTDNISVMDSGINAQVLDFSHFGALSIGGRLL